MQINIFCQKGFLYYFIPEYSIQGNYSKRNFQHLQEQRIKMLITIYVLLIKNTRIYTRRSLAVAVKLSRTAVQGPSIWLATMRTHNSVRQLENMASSKNMNTGR
jgi:hypothetical protein